MASVASRNGAPTMAPIATGPACLPSVMMAMIGISDSGIAVATAASTLPTAPWPRPRRRPAHSTALVNTAAPATITAKLTTSSAPAIRHQTEPAGQAGKPGPFGLREILIDLPNGLASRVRPTLFSTRWLS